MLNRTAKVDALKVASAGLSSVIQVGDSNKIHSFNRAIAIQRQKEIFYTNEAQFDSYSIFTRSLPLHPIHEAVTFQSTSVNPLIKVNSIDIIGMSASAVVHIGNAEQVQTESRILHIRQLEKIDDHSDNGLEEE